MTFVVLRIAVSRSPCCLSTIKSCPKCALVNLTVVFRPSHLKYLQSRPYGPSVDYHFRQFSGWYATRAGNPLKHLLELCVRLGALRFCRCHYLILYSTLLYSTLLYSTLPYSTLLYSTLLYSTLLYPTLLYSTLLYSTLLYSTLLYYSHSTLLYYSHATLLQSTLL